MLFIMKVIKGFLETTCVHPLHLQYNSVLRDTTVAAFSAKEY